MDFKEKLVEILGEENSEKIDGLTKLIPEFFVAKKNYNDMSKRAKEAEEKLTTLEQEIEEVKDSQLPEKEKLVKAIEKAEKAERDSLKKQNRLEAERIFNKAGLDEADYADFIDGFVSEDLDTTIKYTNAFAKTYNDKRAILEQDIKKKLLDETPRLDNNEGMNTGVMSKEEFSKMSVLDKTKLFKENKELYTQLSENGG